ncbi:response regulator transcription factor [Malaciobacter marinus]|uniref:DNA-binding response regulator n=1 Tax=Malaciobacter marinus TaxID=505249 RepID=A0A347TJJ7_9BACT|nr:MULTISPECIES: response regulator [Malaciobacter]AXX86775.1 two-component system response regulator [Malaciobacter marinus]PHO13101.1 DNA-binding response regulator [Malaciobacter marinus]PHO14415.1 DNA-binding response regulator [Malaciobacter marinus]RYA22321.1 DNA-binding response regulator [Malaciobacter halophilus]
MKKELLEQLKNYTILCVEDEEGIRKRLVNTLKYYFKEVYSASNADEGYELYFEYKPSIILSDIEMPKENGIALIEKIRKKDFNTIIIMVTAYSNEEYLLDLINLNVNQYILKPVNSESLLNGILKALASKLTLKIQLNDNLCFHMESRELYFKDELISLRKRDKEFIILLYENKNRVLTYDYIEEYLWKDKSMSMSALKTFIKEFRQRVPEDILINIPQEGYKLKST